MSLGLVEANMGGKEVVVEEISERKDTETSTAHPKITTILRLW